MATSSSGSSVGSHCTVCLRVFLVTAAGLARKHGPINHCCSGSNKPPRQFLQSSVLAQQDPQQASVLAAVTNLVPATSQHQHTHSSNPTSQPQLREEMIHHPLDASRQVWEKER